jgi:hypothetical protein
MFSQGRIQTETPVEGLHVHQLSPPPDSPGTGKDNTSHTHTNTPAFSFQTARAVGLDWVHNNYIASSRRASPIFRAAKIESNSVFAARRDRHIIVNPALHFLLQVKNWISLWR